MPNFTGGAINWYLPHHQHHPLIIMSIFVSANIKSQLNIISKIRPFLTNPTHHALTKVLTKRNIKIKEYDSISEIILFSLNVFQSF